MLYNTNKVLLCAQHPRPHHFILASFLASVQWGGGTHPPGT